MSRHPAHAEDHNEDHRLMKCRSCDRTLPETSNVCPHCNPQAKEVVKLQKKLDRIETIFTLLYYAYAKGNEAATWQFMKELQKEIVKGELRREVG
jgi:predicted amidophosphoribosyltransferase